MKIHGYRFAAVVLPLLALGTPATGFGGGEPTPGSAGTGDTLPVYLAADSRLWVEGTSTVRDYSCTAGVLDATVEVDEARMPFRVDELQQAVSRAVVTIPVAAMDCDNDKMNDHMWKALQREAHPEIRFELDGYAVVPDSSGTVLVDLGGRLTIAGVTQPLTITTTALALPDGNLRVVGDAEFPMTRFGVKPPSLMLGMLKVHDAVVVRFDLTLQAPVH